MTLGEGQFSPNSRASKKRAFVRAACVGGLLLLLLELSFTVNAQDYEWITNNGAITITQYTGNRKSVSIPDTITGMPVTSIGDSAFVFASGVTTVTIPNGVTNIGDHAFFFCSGLTSITLPNSATNIAGYAFAHCTSLPSITLPNGVTCIGSNLFDTCSSLSSITIPNSVLSISEWAFASCANLASIVIGNSVTNIGDYAFYSCASLAGVVIPDSVVSIGKWTFYSCDSLSSATIGSGVTTIGDHAFRSCSSLTGITIPDGVTSIGSNVFAFCLSLASVMVPESVTNIGGYAFLDCVALSAITVAANNPAYASVDGVLFDKTQSTLIQCPEGKSGVFEVPDSVTWIGNQAFDSCTNLTGVYFKESPPGVGSYVFDGADNLTVYYLPGIDGWGPTFGGRPTAPWVLPYPLILTRGPGLGVQTNAFGFVISWATNVPVVVETSTNLSGAFWTPLQSCTLTNGSCHFSDPEWMNYPARFYRLRWP